MCVCVCIMFPFYVFSSVVTLVNKHLYEMTRIVEFENAVNNIDTFIGTNVY